jgi:hypothetical protein
VTVNADNPKFCKVASEKSMLSHMGIQMAVAPALWLFQKMETE